MGIDFVTKNKVLGYLKSNSISGMYIEDFYNMSGKKKYNELNFLEFFVNYINDVFDGKIIVSANLLVKLIEANGVFLNICLGKKYEIDLGLVAKMRTYKDAYQKYCDTNSLEVDKILIKAIEAIDKLLDSKYKDNSEDNSIYLSKVKELEDKVLELTKALNSEQSNNEILVKKVEICEKRLKKQDDDLTQTRSVLYDKEREVTRLEGIEESFEELKNQYNGVKSHNSLLEGKVDELSQTVEEQSGRIEVYQRQDEKLARETFLDEQIFNLLLNDKLSLKDIICILNDKGFNVNNNEVMDSINRIKRVVNIEDKNNLVVPKLYGVSRELVLSENNLMLNVEPNSSLDIMLIADMHVDKVNNKLLDLMNEVYDYCTINNIENIINLGDFLDSSSTVTNKNKKNFDNLIKLLNDIISQFPISDISHIILGGNHDKDFLEFGFDPINYIADSREDYINLGYDNAFVTFSDVSKEFIMLHHKGLPIEKPGAFDYIEKNKINERISDYYKSINVDRSDSYIDFFAHLHRSRLDVFNNYCIVPSLTKNNDFCTNGAWHLKIFFDEKKEIKYIILIPLVFNKKLLPVSEQVYQKIKKI